MFTIENDIIEVKYVEANAAHNAAVNTSLTADNALIDYLARNLPCLLYTSPSPRD